VSLADSRIARRLGVEGLLVLGGEEQRRCPGWVRGTRQVPAGLVLGDVIVAINGEPVRSPREMRRILDQMQVGDAVRLTVEREGRQIDLAVTLDAVE